MRVVGRAGIQVRLGGKREGQVMAVLGRGSEARQDEGVRKIIGQGWVGQYREKTVQQPSTHKKYTGSKFKEGKLSFFDACIYIRKHKQY